MRSNEDIESAIAHHGTSVVRACSAYLPTHDAEDVFQETFLRYARSTTVFDGDEHRKAWLIRVAINLCKDVMKSPRYGDESIEEIAEPSVQPEQDAVADRMRLRGALDKLPPDQRAAVVLSAVAGCTASEIAKILDKPENTVYSLVRRGKIKLREVLEHEGS